MAHFVYVIGTLAAGGSERQLSYAVSALRGSGHEVTVAVWNFLEDDVYVEPVRRGGGKVASLGDGSPLRKFLRLRRLIKATRADLVQAYSFYLNVVVAAAAAGTKALAVGCIRSTLAIAEEGCGPLIGRVSARWPRRNVSNNAHAAEEARARRFFRPRRIAVVPNHIDVDAFPDAPVPGGTPVIAAIGSLLAYKRWDRLIAAAARLRDGGLDFRVVIAGEGPMRAALEAQTAALDLGDRVSLLGFVKDVKQVLAGASLFVHVSETEGSPNVVIEALAAGRAVVATGVGDVPRLVKDGETGFVVGDDEALFERIAALLRDRDRCVAMGRRARAAAKERFGSASFAAQILEAYRAMGWRS